MNAIPANGKTAALAFLDEHDRIKDELAKANLVIDDQTRELHKQDALIAVQREQIAQLTADKDLYLRYAFELSAQLQFIVAGSVRALQVAAQVRNAIAMHSAGVPEVPGADIAQVEDILHRIGEHNAKAGDGYGLTNKCDAGCGKPPCPVHGDIDAATTEHAYYKPGMYQEAELRRVNEQIVKCHCGRENGCPDANGNTFCPAPGDPLAPFFEKDGKRVEPPAAVVIGRDGKPLELTNATRSLMGHQ